MSALLASLGRLVAVAIGGAIVALIVAGAVTFVAFMSCGTASPTSSDVFGVLVAAGSLSVGIVAARMLWFKVRLRNRELEYWQSEARAALHGLPSLPRGGGERTTLTGDGFAWGKQGRETFLRWVDVRRIAIRTSEAKASVDDDFWVFTRQDGTDLELPLRAVDGEVVSHMQRFVAFDNGQLLIAIGATVPGEFVCWSRNDAGAVSAAGEGVSPAEKRR